MLKPMRSPHQTPDPEPAMGSWPLVHGWGKPHKTLAGGARDPKAVGSHTQGRDHLSKSPQRELVPPVTYAPGGNHRAAAS